MGRDVLGSAQTGTGKTAGFTLPMLDILSGSRARARMPRSLILEPTRELALQVAENFVQYGKYLKLTHALIIGGESMSDQKDLLMRGVDVLIATPGRLIDMFERGGMLLTDTRLLVIDEADRMLDMGFIPDVERIVNLLPKTRQTLFFSATMAPEIRRLADAFLQNPKEISVSKPATVATHHHQRSRARRRARQARGAAPADPQRGRAERADLLQPQARRRHPLQVADPARLQRRRAARRHGAAGALRDAGEVQGRRDPPALLQRRGGARPRHRRPVARVQLRRADPRRGLRPPHRPHRPRRPGGPRVHDRRAGGSARRRGDREADRRADPARRDPRAGRGRMGRGRRPQARRRRGGKPAAAKGGRERARPRQGSARQDKRGPRTRAAKTPTPQPREIAAEPPRADAPRDRPHPPRTRIVRNAPAPNTRPAGTCPRPRAGRVPTAAAGRAGSYRPGPCRSASCPDYAAGRSIASRSRAALSRRRSRAVRRRLRRRRPAFMLVAARPRRDGFGAAGRGTRRSES